MSGYQTKVNVKNESGAILIMVLIVYSSLVIFSGLVFSLVVDDAQRVEMEQSRVQALYLAEAGISQAMFELKNYADTDDNGIGTVAKRALGTGSFYVRHDAKRLTIISVGEVNGIRRELEMQYGSF